MLSNNELILFDQRVKNILQIDTVQYVVEHKIDGLAINLIYENGKLVKAATRGDGSLSVIHSLSKSIGDIIIKYQKYFCVN